MNSVIGLSFHHLLSGFLLPFQVCVFASVCFAKFVLLQLLVLSNVTSFVCCQIHFGNLFIFGTMADVLMKEARLVVAVDDLDFEIGDITFEAKMFNRYDTFDQIANRSMEDPCYAHLHCDLLDKATILKVKSPHIDMHEQHLQKCMFVKVNVFCIESKSKRGFKKCDMHVVITIELTTNVSSILAFQFELHNCSYTTNYQMFNLHSKR
jgi:hypothetical protein